MGDLSKNFSAKELFKPETYQSMISAGADPRWFINQKLVDRLQIIRDHFMQPITIHRAFSTMAENMVVKGAKWSQHMFGNACDFDVEDVPAEVVCKFIAKEFFDGAYGAIDETSVHVDVRNSLAPIEIKY